VREEPKTGGPPKVAWPLCPRRRRVYKFTRFHRCSNGKDNPAPASHVGAPRSDWAYIPRCASGCG